MSKTKLVRIDKDVEKRLKSIMEYRYKNGLAKLNMRDLSVAESLRLTLRSPSWKEVERELRNLPKKENIR